MLVIFSIFFSFNSPADFDYLKTVNEVSALYENSFDPPLEIDINWKSDEENIYASYKNVAKLHLFGGLIRHPMMTEDTFALTICHELGHILAGKPKKAFLFKPYDENFWASAEGQADYFASGKCMKRYLYGKDHHTFLTSTKIPPSLKNLCEINTEDLESYHICLRIGIASFNAIKINQNKQHDFTPISFATPSSKIVSATNIFAYPDFQCRLDNFMAAALCPLDIKSEQYCSQENGYPEFSRSKCWFHP